MDARPAILGVAMLASFALVAGGVRLARRHAERRRGVLMIVAAFVLFANVLLWAWPMPARAAAPLPADVRAFLARRAACAQRRSEPPDDRGRAATGAAQACGTADRDFRRLRLRYRGDRRVLDTIARPGGA